MNKSYRLLPGDQDQQVKAAWAQVLVIMNQPRREASRQAAHRQLDDFINPPRPPDSNPAK